MDALAGPQGYRFNPVTGELRVDVKVESARVSKELKDAGFGVRNSREPANDTALWKRYGHVVLTGSAAAFCLAGILLDYVEQGSPGSRVLLVCSIALSGWKVLQKSIAAVRSLSLDMNVLMTIAAIGALFIDKWGEAAAVMVLFSLSLLIESYSATRTRRAIQSLMAAAPAEARVVRNGVEQTTAATHVRPGESIIIRPGERLPLDGIVENGKSSVNQSAVTGESRLVEKATGDAVYAGSFNEHGSLTIRVTKRFEETALAHIVHQVEDAQNQRAHVQQLVDKFARVYTPSVVGIAAFIAVVPPLMFNQPLIDWTYRALVLLVIACPCALVISTPVTMVSAITAAARRGVLIKGGKNIEVLSAVRAVAFDKTGTLTEGKPTVTDIVTLNSLSRNDILGIVATLEHRSEHHLASGVLAEASRSSIEPRSVSDFVAIPGRGVKGSVDGVLYYFGNHQLCEEQGFCSALVESHLERFGSEGKTAVILGKGNEALAIIAICDGTRPQSGIIMNQLRECGIDTIVMLTGDDEPTARRLGAETGIEEIHAGLLPADKVAIIERLKHSHGTVAMVGDGINDAPALAASSVGIAMGVTGTDVALEAADVTLMSDDLGKLPFLFRLSRKAISIVKQNIALALGLKVAFLLLTFVGMSTLWMAVLADDGAALLVIFNGLRILSFKE